MFLHIGNNKMIEMENIVAIINLKEVHADQRLVQSIEDLKSAGKNLQSLIITKEGYDFSSISSKTLWERSIQSLSC